MKGEKMDRRVKYTKMVLRESFIKLLSQKDLSKITIKEICEDADINRATFYAHYTDQYDLMKKIENELFDNITVYLADYIQNDDFTDPVEMVQQIFEYIKENAQLCKLLLSERGDINFQKRVTMLVYDRIILDLTSNHAIPKEDAEHIYSFNITGCVGVIQKWLEDDMRKSTRFMAEFVVKNTRGLSAVLSSQSH